MTFVANIYNQCFNFNLLKLYKCKIMIMNYNLYFPETKTLNRKMETPSHNITHHKDECLLHRQLQCFNYPFFHIMNQLKKILLCKGLHIEHLIVTVREPHLGLLLHILHHVVETHIRHICYKHYE